MSQLILASQSERDAVVQRLQVAFAEHRLDDEEFDQRVRQALTARTRSDLDTLTLDLPAGTTDREAVTDLPAASGRRPGKLAVALKGSITRSGRWTVPARLYCVVYKGSGLLDLRAAELTAPVTSIVAVAYKSGTKILLPPGVRLELGGTGVSTTGDTDGRPDLLPRDAAVVRIRGIAYKGTIEAISGRSGH
ncbi:MAG TPA: DUF1707 domain-containing protein [Streptosporangiaceae bacterium]